MSSASFLKSVLSSFAQALQPVRAAVASPDAFAAFLQQFGWTLAPADLAHVTGALGDLTSLPSDTSSLSLEQLTGELLSAGNVIRRISTSGAPAAFASTFPRELLDYLVYSALAQQGPPLFALLHFVGVLSERRVPAAPDTGRAEYIERQVHWDRLGPLGDQPLATIERTYGWGAAFDADAFLRSIGILVRGFGGNAGLYAADRRLIDQYYARDSSGTAKTRNLIISMPALGGSATSGGAGANVKLAFLALPIPPRPDVAALPDGVALMPVITGQASDTFTISEYISLKLTGDFLARPIRAEVHPGRAVVRGSVGDSHVNTVVRLDAKAKPDAPWIPLGDTNSSRLEVFVAHASLALSGQLDGDADLRTEVGVDAGSLVIDFGESDGFLQEAVASHPISSPLSFTLVWSNRSGFSLGNQPKLQLSLPVRQSLGTAARLERIDLALGVGPNLDLQFDFKPPSGAGLAIDAAGVSGGGFLFHDATQQLYAGSLMLSLNDTITLSAFGLIATKMPDGSRGYSLIVFITAEDFEPIPLGLGFTLQGIGGMIAVNRTFDQDVLRAGMQNDTLKSLLFPRDPVGNAPAIIRSLASAFPAQRGAYLLGILAKIDWFTPTLVELDLALILEFGARERLLVLGRISSLLPSADNDLVRINLDAIGVLDFDQNTAAIDAVLVDSRLVHKYALTGAAALRAGWGSAENTDFVLSIGGFNPRFAPPAAVPPLARVAIALSSGTNPRLTCDAYFAITSNTIQFGAGAQLYAEAYGFSISGDVGYDVLIARAPLHFIADFHASVQLKHGSDNLFKVSVEGELEGPLPLRLSGKARFEILWCDFAVRFDTTLIQGEPPPLPPAVDVLAQLEAALSTPQSWSTQLAPNRTHGVALRKLAPGSGLELDPLGRLAVNESVVPLDTGRDIDSFGGAPVAGARRFTLSVALNGVALTETRPLQARFAPAQFFAMSDDEELASPSFETMDSGLVVGTDAVSFDPAQLVAAPVEYRAITIDPLAATTPPPGSYTLPASRLALHSASGAAARAPLRRLGRGRFRSAAPVAVSLARPSWAIVPLDGGTPVALDRSVKTWTDYRAALDALNRGGASFQLVPAREIAA